MSIDIRPNPASAGSVTGGLVYKGSYDAALQTPNLVNSLKGDFYIVSDAGALAGVALNIGDHIVFNQDASSPITSAMFDVIDNTDAVASVNGLTGTVVLNLKTINDVNATLTPSDSTFLVGDGSEWIGESGATARTSLGLGSAATEDVGTGANNVVQLDGSSRLPAVDGSQLTNITATDATKLAIANNLSDLNNAGTARTNLGLGSAATKDTGTSNGQVVLLDAVGLPAVDGSQLTNITATDATKLAIANNLSDLNNVGTARTNLGLGTSATEDVGTGANDIVQLDGSSRLPAVDGSQLTNVTGTDATKLAIANNLSDLNNAGTARTNLGLGSAATKDTGTSNGQVVLLDAVGLPAVDGSQLTNVTGTDATKLAIANNLSDLNNAGTARTNLGLAIGSDVQAFDAQLADVAGLTPADGAFIVGDGSNFVTETLATARTSLGLGTVATLDVGTGANNVVQLDGSSRLPAVDGSLLTNVTATETDTLNDVVGRGATTSTPITVGDLKINSDAAGTSTSGSIATLASNNNIKLDPHGSGVPELVGNATRGSGQLQFNCEQNSHGIILKGPPHSAGASYTMILPDSLGSNGQVLSLQDASTGELTFSTSGAGDLLASNNLSDLDNAGTARTNLGLAIGTNVQAFDAQLTDIAGLTPTDSHIIIGDGSNFVTESGATARTSLGLSIGSDVQAFDAQLADVAGLTPSDGGFIVGDGSNFVLESGATARTSLDLGTVATLDVGTGANNVVQLDGSSRLPAVDGSQLTNLPSGGGSRPTVTAITAASYTIGTTDSAIGASELERIYTCSSSAATVNLPSSSGLTGFKVQIKNLLSSTITIDPSGAEQIDSGGAGVAIELTVQYSSVTLCSDGTGWIII